MQQGNLDQGNPQYHSNRYVDELVYQRKDGKRMEMSFVHLPNSEPVLRAALYAQDEEEQPISEGPELTLEEVRYRYRFYKQLAESGKLDQQAS